MNEIIKFKAISHPSGRQAVMVTKIINEHEAIGAVYPVKEVEE